MRVVNQNYLSNMIKEETRKCHVCNKNIEKASNKKYCSVECRYKDSEFKKNKWNTKESLEKNPEYLKAHKEGQKKSLEARNKKYKSGELVPWNKGLTKENNESLRKISEDRKGDKNPAYKMLNDEEKKKKWIKKLKKTNVQYKNIGKKYEEIYGVEKALEMKKKQSESAKKRTVHGHTGHKHSNKTKQKLKETTTKWLTSGKAKHTFTEPMKKFLSLLEELKIDDKFEKEYNEVYYSIDFAYPEINLAIEIDGDFYHCNPNTRHKTPKYAIQKKNLRNDKAKTTFLKNRGWTLLRFWEDDINNNIDGVKKILLETIYANKKNSKAKQTKSKKNRKQNKL